MIGEIVGWTCLVGVIAAGLVALWLVGQLLVRLEWLRMRGFAAGALPSMTSGRPGELLGWLWTDGHRSIGDAALTRLVFIARGMTVLHVALPMIIALVTGLSRPG